MKFKKSEKIKLTWCAYFLLKVYWTFNNIWVCYAVKGIGFWNVSWWRWWLKDHIVLESDFERILDSLRRDLSLSEVVTIIEPQRTVGKCYVKELRSYYEMLESFLGNIHFFGSFHHRLTTHNANAHNIEWIRCTCWLISLICTACLWCTCERFQALYEMW